MFVCLNLNLHFILLSYIDVRFIKYSHPYLLDANCSNKNKLIIDMINYELASMNYVNILFTKTLLNHHSEK